MGSYGSVNKQVASNAQGAYGKQVEQFTNLEAGLEQSRRAAMSALKSQQGLAEALPGQLAKARGAGMESIRANNANAIGAAGSRAAMQGAGGYGALLQAGKQGGLDAAQFGVNATVDAAKTMQAMNSQTGQMSSDLLATVTGGYNALQDAGGSIEAMTNEALAEAKAEMAQIFADYDGLYNTDDEEAQYKAKMEALINSTNNPAVREQLIALKAYYDKQFYDTGETTSGLKPPTGAY